MTVKRFKIENVFKGVDRLTGPVGRMQRRIGKFTRTAERGMRRVNKVTSAVGRTMATGLKMGIKAATGAMVAFGAVAAKVISKGAEFEKTLVTAAIKFPEKIKRGTKAYDELEKAALRVGETTEFSASQSAEALTFLAMAGFDAKQSIAALPGVVDLATTSGLDLALATDIATDTLGAMGMVTKDNAELITNLARVNDVMSKGANIANTTIEQMFEAIKAGGATATQAGADIETFTAMLDVLATSKKGEAAGTSLRNMFLRIQAPAKSAAGLVKKFAGNIADDKGNMIDMVEVLRTMEGRLNKLGGIERAKVLDKIFGKKAIEAANLLFAAGADQIDKYRDKLKGATGESGEVAKEIRNTTAGSIKSLEAAIESVTISLFKLEDKGLKAVIDGTVKWIRENKKLIQSRIGNFLRYIIDNFDDIVSKAKTLGIVITVIFGIVGAVKALTAALTLVNLVMAANPLTLMIMGLVALVAFAVGAIIANWDDIVYFFKEIWRVITEVAGRFGRSFLHFFEILWEGIKEGAIALKNFFMPYWEFIGNLFNSKIGWIIFGPIKALVEIVKAIKKNWEPIKQFFKDLWDGIVEVFSWAYDKIKPIIDAFKAVGKIAFEAFFTTKNVPGANQENNVVNRTEKQLPVVKEQPVNLSFTKEQPVNLSFTKEQQVNMTVTGPERTDAFDTVSPMAKVTNLFEQQMSVEKQQVELTIKDESGKAEVTSGELGSMMSLEPTGSF